MSDQAPPAPTPEAQPAPAEQQPQVQKGESGEKPEASSTVERVEPTPKDAVKRAFDAMDQIDKNRAEGRDPAAPPEPKKAEAKAEPKTEAKSKGPERNPDGTFKSANPEPKTEAKAEPKTAPKTEAKTEHDDLDTPPSRFSQDAKEIWAKADPAVRGEVKRALKELETGLTKYKSQVEPIREFMEMAEKVGTDLPTALKNYTGIEQLLRTNPPEGLKTVVANLGLSPQQAAQMLVGNQSQQGQPQQGQPQQGQASPEVEALRQELAQLKQVMGQQAQQTYQQSVEATSKQVHDFAAEHPRLEELSEEVVRQINAGYSLEEAYERAERLNPAPVPQADPTPAPTAQTQKAGLSVSGAPASGSSPDARKTPSSAKEAVNRAFSQLL